MREVLTYLRSILGLLGRLMATTEAVLDTQTALATSATTQTETLETLTALLTRQDERLAVLEEAVEETKRIRELLEQMAESLDGNPSAAGE